MIDQGTKNLMVFEGIVSIAFGIAAVFWPGLTILTLLYIFASYILVMGLINMMSGIFQIKTNPSSWYLKLLVGVLEIGAGVYSKTSKSNFRNLHLTNWICFDFQWLIQNSSFSIRKTTFNNQDFPTNRRCLKPWCWSICTIPASS